jgi:Putative Zn-dependent protease, contains TPR repeats
MRKASFVLGSMLATAGWLGIAGTTMLVLPVTAEAQQVSAKVGVPLKAAQEAIGKKRWDTALGKIKEADGTAGKTAFDQYKINEMLWYVYLQQGRNADAAKVLEGQIASAQMPANEKVQRTKTLAQLYARAGNYGKAAQTAQSYLKSAPGDKEMQLLVANAYYMQKDYKGAIAAAERVMKGGGTPSQDLLQLVLRSYYELNDSAGTARTLEQLLKFYPTQDTWVRVIDGYLKQTKHDDELMALYRLADDVGALQEPRQYVDMTQALVIGGFGQEGERVMQKGIAANLFQGEDLSRAKRTLDAAKRKADQERVALPKAAGQLAAARTGDELIGIGKLYFSAGDYAKASEALQQGLAKGGVQDVDGANMLLGIALKRKGDKAGAGKAFDAVKDPKAAEVGKLWKIAAR